MKNPFKIQNFNFKCYILCKQAERDVLLTISHMTIKTFCLLLPFILQFLQFWSCDGIQIFTGDLVFVSPAFMLSGISVPTLMGKREARMWSIDLFRYTVTSNSNKSNIVMLSNLSKTFVTHIYSSSSIVMYTVISRISKTKSNM